MQRQIRHVGIGLLVGFVGVFAMLNYVQFFAADSIASNRANTRSLLAEYSIKRGDIVTADSVTVARSRATKDILKYRRLYPGGSLFGHITGYYSHLYGTDQIERSFNDFLLGEAGEISMQEIEDRLFGGEKQGDDVILTIDSRLQEAARDILGEQRGSIVAIDPNSDNDSAAGRAGDVLAMWSYPSYDPEPLASHRGREARRFRQQLDPETSLSPLINSAAIKRYPPGSTFKVVVTAAALENGYKPQSKFDDPIELELPQTTETLQNFSRSYCLSGTEIDLFNALRISCDTTYGILGLEIPDEIADTAEAMGFNEPLPFDVRNSASVFPEIPDDSEPLRAFSGIGQGSVDASPLQMALVAASVANDGQTPRPRLVSEIVDRAGAPVETYEPESIGEAMSPDSANKLTEMMVAVVEDGTGTAAQIPGVKVAGKTGTSQTGREGENPHTWFIAFAPADDPEIAVAVIVENGGATGSETTGGAVAAPLAKALIERDKQIRGW